MQETQSRLRVAGIVGLAIPVGLLSTPTFATRAPLTECATRPSNGQVLEDNAGWTERANAVAVQNGARGDAIVKIRDAQSGRLMVSFFVTNNASARYEFVPDGSYRIQYAFGNALDGSCKSFAHFSTLGEFPGDDTLKGVALGPQMNWRVLSYTLYPIPGGNVIPHSIDAPRFEAP